MDRFSELTDIAVRPPQAVLPENEPSYRRIYEQAKQRTTVAGQEEMGRNLEAAYAAGEPGLLRQAIPNYITDEALVRSFVGGFGIVLQEGSPDELPEYTIAEPTAVDIVTVAVTGGAGGPRAEVQYKVTETQSTGRWKEFVVGPAIIPFVNPIFPRRRVLVEALAADKLAYYARKELDNLAWTIITGTALVTSFGSSKVWSFKDADVAGLPTGNSKTSTVSFWKTLRTNVIPYFQGIGMADRVINVHVLHTDLQYLYQVAPVGAALGGYSDFQQQVYEGGLRDIQIYGHRFRIIPENWKVASGELFANAGPVYKMWLPPVGNVTHRVRREDMSEARSLSRVYEILSPSIWWKNILKSTWSVTNTDG